MKRSPEIYGKIVMMMKNIKETPTSNFPEIKSLPIAMMKIQKRSFIFMMMFNQFHAIILIVSDYSCFFKKKIERNPRKKAAKKLYLPLDEKVRDSINENNQTFDSKKRDETIQSQVQDGTPNATTKNIQTLLNNSRISDKDVTFEKLHQQALQNFPDSSKNDRKNISSPMNKCKFLIK